MTHSEAKQILERFSHQLGEHFDAVQILASWHEEGVTRCLPWGSGNWYARQGMAQEFISTTRAREIAREVAENISPDDGGEEWKQKS